LLPSLLFALGDQQGERRHPQQPTRY
jgi:hypothetical protein